MNKLLILFIITTFCYSTANAEELNVNIHGVNPAIEKSLKNSLSIYKAIGEHKLSSSRIQNLNDLANEQILNALSSLGYYHAKVEIALNLKEGSSKSKLWVADYNIELGPPNMITNIKFSITGPGQQDPTLCQALEKAKNAKITVNTVLTQNNYEDAKDDIISVAHDFGFLNAKFTKNILKINRNINQSNIELVLHTGEKYTFGEVIFTGSKYQDSFLQRYVPFKSNNNETYTAEKLNLLHQNLNASEMFSKIRLDPEPQLDDPNNNVVPIIVRLTDKASNQYNGRIGYGTDTSIRASIGWQHRIANSAGHKLNLGASGSTRKKQAFSNYIIPGNNPANEKYILGISATNEKSQNKLSNQAEISISKTKKLDFWQSAYTLQHLHEKFKLISSSELKQKHYLLPCAKIIWNDIKDLDGIIFGKKAEFSIKYANKNLLSSNNLTQIEAKFKYILPIGQQYRLLMRAAIGCTETSNFENIPFSLRFFTGGDNTVRGFGYRSLGPTEVDQNGKVTVVGGKKLIETSLEIDRKINQELYLAMFMDAGNVANKWPSTLPKSAGMGIRWATKIGMFRIDCARQIKYISSKKPRFHLTFGKDL